MDLDFKAPVNTKKEERIIQELKEFQEGVIPFLENLLENFKMLHKILNSNLLTSEEKRSIFYELKDIEFKLKDVSNKIRNLLLELANDTILQEAQREYYAFFKDEPNQNKYNFLILGLYLIKLKDFYDLVYEHISDIKKIIVEKIPPQSDFYQQFVDFQLKTVFYKLQKLYHFIERLSIICHYKKEKNKTFFGSIQYSPHIDYTYSLVFKDNLQSYIQTFFQESQDKPKPKSPEIQKKIITQPIESPKTRKKYIKENILDTSGKYVWNSSIYYFLSYDPVKLQKEDLFFKNVFYIDTHIGATPDLVRSQVIRSYLRKQKIISPEEAKEKYKNFLNSLFELNQQVLCFNFKIQEANIYFFMYHLGPFSFFHINKQYLLDLKTGTIHQIISKNLIRKVIPLEYIKKHLFQWWMDNILENISEEDKNNYSKYNQMVAYIQKFIFSIQIEYEQKYPDKKAHYENTDFQNYIKEKIGILNTILLQRYLNLFKYFEIK